jgi:hypothetical protein
MASKKHRKKIKSFYKCQNEKSNEILKVPQTELKEEPPKKDERKWLDIATVEVKDLPPASQLLEKIKTFMTGTSKFVIYVKKQTQVKFAGVFVQSGGSKKEFEVFPDIDKVLFSVREDGLIEIAYTRVYSDFLPSVSKFTLNEIEKVEEFLPE